MREIFGEEGLCRDGHDSSISFKERRRTYIAKNNSGKRILKYRIDGVMITSGRKCDFGLAVYEAAPDKNTLYLIELKGSSFASAVEQILDTISTINHKIRKADVNVNARIVMKRSPTPYLRNNNSKYRQLDKMLKGRIIIKNEKLEEPI